MSFRYPTIENHFPRQLKVSRREERCWKIFWKWKIGPNPKQWRVLLCPELVPKLQETNTGQVFRFPLPIILWYYGFQEHTKCLLYLYRRQYISQEHTGRNISLWLLTVSLWALRSRLNAWEFLPTNSCRYFYSLLQNIQSSSKIWHPSHFDTTQETAQKILLKSWNVAKVMGA